MFETVTDFGDATLILPASLILLAYLWTTGAHRIALVWGASLVSVIFLLILSKICFHACSAWGAPLNIVSPSGHTAIATLFYGVGALLLGRGRSRPVRIALGALALVLIAGVAFSRIALGFHTAPEVAAGLSVGLMGVAMFRIASGTAGEVLPVPRGAVVAFVLLALVSHGRHIDAEHWILQLSGEFRSTAEVCTAASLPPFQGATPQSS